jgi:hypothetical protein
MAANTRTAEEQRKVEGGLNDAWFAVPDKLSGGNGTLRIWVKSHNGLIVDVSTSEPDVQSMLTYSSDWSSNIASPHYPSIERAYGMGRTMSLTSEISNKHAAAVEVANDDRAIAMARLRGRVGSDRIVNLRNWRLGEKFNKKTRRHLWLYLEYCELKGSLV